MLFQKSLSSDLRLYRILLLVGGIAYFAFWFILKSVEPDAFDPILGRAAVSLIILLVLALSYKVAFFRDYIVVSAYFLSHLLTYYYIFLLANNYYSYTYSIGFMTIMFGTAVIFKDSNSLLAYLAMSIAAVGLGYVFVEYPAVPPLMYVSILSTTAIISYLAMSIRFNIQKELDAQNKNLQQVYAEIDKQRRLVEMKNVDITDSIVYAKKIQFSIIPEKEGLKDFIRDSFIYYRVKDIVSGDFYWYHKKGDELYIAAVDCTGHGVPGALVSMIGITLLKQTIDHQHIVEPGEILSNMQKEIYSFLQRGSSDGMEISLCSVNLEKKRISYAGAMMKLIMVRNGILTEIKGDRHSISRNTSYEAAFTNHTINFEAGDTFYIFTDGYCDQFGGEKQKKFMFKRFEKLLTEINPLTMRQQKSTLEQTYKGWKGELEQVDDILIIGFKF
ncbi:MAG: SpoIIE family protein phosphatase [Crocinitomicaceae bacterium]|nr:SpoIIE family protein phosphatase [Crocinitomicaceae bacterium]